MHSTGIHVVRKDDHSELELREACQKLCKVFIDLFKMELGSLKDFELLEITFKPDATPVFPKPQTVPYALQEDLMQPTRQESREVSGYPHCSMSIGLQWCPYIRLLYRGSENQSYGCAVITQSPSTLN